MEKLIELLNQPLYLEVIRTSLVIAKENNYGNYQTSKLISLELQRKLKKEML